MGDDEYGSISSESVPGILIKAANEVPDVIALSVKRDEKWINWTYQEYLQGIYVYTDMLSLIRTDTKICH